LLGVHRRRLAGRDAEEGGIEAIDPVEEGAEPRPRFVIRQRLARALPGGDQTLDRGLVYRMLPGGQ
jgi:hypothetical protein